MAEYRDKECIEFLCKRFADQANREPKFDVNELKDYFEKLSAFYSRPDDEVQLLSEDLCPYVVAILKILKAILEIDAARAKGENLDSADLVVGVALYDAEKEVKSYIKKAYGKSCK